MKRIVMEASEVVVRRKESCNPEEREERVIYTRGKFTEQVSQRVSREISVRKLRGK